MLVYYDVSNLLECKKDDIFKSFNKIIINLSDLFWLNKLFSLPIVQRNSANERSLIFTI